MPGDESRLPEDYKRMALKGLAHYNLPEEVKNTILDICTIIYVLSSARGEVDGALRAVGAIKSGVEDTVRNRDITPKAAPPKQE